MRSFSLPFYLRRKSTKGHQRIRSQASSRRGRHFRSLHLEVLQTRTLLASDLGFEADNWASSQALIGERLDATVQSFLVSQDDPAEHVVTDASFDGVPLLAVERGGKEYYCSGALLEPGGGNLVLTAAHCLTDGEGRVDASATTVYLAPTYETLEVTNFIVQGKWDGITRNGDDIAILELTEAAADTFDRYAIYRGETDEVDQEFTKVGFGRHGQGDQGAGELDFLQRSGRNLYEADGDLLTDIRFADGIAITSGDKQLVYDFDSGSAQHDAFGIRYGISDTGLGDDEVAAAPGDSGGPSFIDGKIAGVTSYGVHTEEDIDEEVNSSYGEFLVDTRVSAFADWIDDIASDPLMLVNNVAGVSTITNDRTVTVAFRNLSARRVRFAFNGAPYRDDQWMDFQPSTKVLIPSWQGTNYVNAQIELEDGEVKTLYQKIDYAKPEMVLNGGAALTNNRDVSVSFAKVAPDAKRVRFAFNGSAFREDQWADFQPSMNVRIPSWQGTNFVNAQIEYENGLVKTLYQRIDYARPVMTINDGASTTTSRDVNVSFAMVAPDARRVRVAFNGSEFREDQWTDYRPSMMTRIPNWQGTNYVIAEIEYEDGSVIRLYGSVIYAPPV